MQLSLLLNLCSVNRVIDTASVTTGRLILKVWRKHISQQWLNPRQSGGSLAGFLHCGVFFSDLNIFAIGNFLALRSDSYSQGRGGARLFHGCRHECVDSCKDVKYKPRQVEEKSLGGVLFIRNFFVNIWNYSLLYLSFWGLFYWVLFQERLLLH